MQGQPMPGPSFQPMGFVGVGPCPGPMPMPMVTRFSRTKLSLISECMSVADSEVAPNCSGDGASTCANATRAESELATRATRRGPQAGYVAKNMMIFHSPVCRPFRPANFQQQPWRRNFRRLEAYKKKHRSEVGSCFPQDRRVLRALTLVLVRAVGQAGKPDQDQSL